jgi:hypothetical protein
MNILEWVCGILALLSSLILLMVNWSGEIRTMRIVETALIVVMLGILLFYSTKISGRMEELRAVIKDFDHPQQSAEYVRAKSEFDGLHKQYSTLVSVNLILIAGTFVVSMVTAIKH